MHEVLALTRAQSLELCFSVRREHQHHRESHGNANSVGLQILTQLPVPLQAP